MSSVDEYRQKLYELSATRAEQRKKVKPAAQVRYTELRNQFSEVSKTLYELSKEIGDHTEDTFIEQKLTEFDSETDNMRDAIYVQAIENVYNPPSDVPVIPDGVDPEAKRVIIRGEGRAP